VVEELRAVPEMVNSARTEGTEYDGAGLCAHSDQSGAQEDRFCSDPLRIQSPKQVMALLAAAGTAGGVGVIANS
jgi:hypothetical protein